jgi:shikimate kinase
MFIALIGYRGSGKTNVAPRVATRLGWSWIDADDEIERRAGKTIATIFADDGEAAFRDWESGILEELVSRDRTVLALGGGVVLRAENREQLGDGRGKVVWLKAAPHTLQQRIAADVTTTVRRPNLTAAGGLLEIQLLLNQREPLYKECADLIVDTEGKTPETVAAEIVDWFQQSADLR